MPNKKDDRHDEAEAKAEGPTFPSILDALSTGPDGKVCPFIPATILMMPVNPKQRTGLELMVRSAGDVQGAFVRHYTPCLKGLCMAWEAFKLEEGDPGLGNGCCRLIPTK